MNNYTDNTLVIMLWNCNGIINKKHELELFLHLNRIAIALIYETHLTCNKSFSISGYSTYCASHPDGEDLMEE